MERAANALPVGITRKAVERELRNVLESKQFAQSERMRRFLQLVVEKSLNDNADDLKEYSIGVEAFDRPPDFDPRVDSIVRVEARRLRKKLKQYRDENPSNEAVRIRIPDGAYVAVFESADGPAPKEPSSLVQMPPSDAEHSLAVLPFASLSPAPEDRTFADGLTEELINELAQHDQLRVVGRSSSFQFRDQPHDAREVAERLRVNYLADGSVRRSGDQIRVTAQLIHAPDGFQLWSGRFDRTMEDVFKLQDEISSSIAAVLTDKLGLRPRRALGQMPRRIVAPAAYQKLTEGRHFARQMTPASLRRSMVCFQEAVQQDPQMAVAYAWIAGALLQLSLFGETSTAMVATEAELSLTRALSLAPELSIAHTWRGLLRGAGRAQWAEAEEDFLHAIELNPNSAEARIYFAVTLLAPQERFEEARQQLSAAGQIDPASVLIHTAWAVTNYLEGRFEETVENCEEAIRLHSEFFGAHRLAAFSQLELGRPQEALRLLAEGREKARGDARFVAAQALASRLASEKQQAAAFAAELHQMAERRYVAAYDRAMARLAADDLDGANQCLYTARMELEIWLPTVFRDPAFASLRGTAGFEELRRVEFADEQPSVA